MPLPPFQRFLDDHREPVHRYLVAAVGSADADDCFQETFMAALRAYPRLRPASNLSAWIFTIAQSKVLDLHRSRARAPVPVEELPELPAADAPPDGDPALWQRVRTLPPKQRAAVVHRYVGGLPYAEIGAVMGCSEAAARQNVRAGLRRVRETWTH